MAFSREAVQYLMSGMSPLVESGKSFIALPSGFLIAEDQSNTEEPLADRWWLGNAAHVIDRAIEYKERLLNGDESTGSTHLLQYGAVTDAWNSELETLMDM